MPGNLELYEITVRTCKVYTYTMLIASDKGQNHAEELALSEAKKSYEWQWTGGNWDLEYEIERTERREAIIDIGTER